MFRYHLLLVFCVLGLIVSEPVSAQGRKPTPVGTWVPTKDDETLIASTLTFKSDGTGSDRLGSSKVVSTFRWSQSGDSITIRQDAGAKLTIKATLFNGGNSLRVYSTTNSSLFTDYKKKESEG